MSSSLCLIHIPPFTSTIQRIYIYIYIIYISHHCTQEFDKDGDGVLSAPEVGSALRSRNVDITDEQVQMFIDGENRFHISCFWILVHNAVVYVMKYMDTLQWWIYLTATL